MKRFLLHLSLAAVAATAGWHVGSRSSTGEKSPEVARLPTAPRPVAPASVSAWQSQLAAVRGVPGAAAETAWVKWAFGVPDADVPAAIAKLNPRSDLDALRCLYARWVKLDPAAAWSSFRRSAIPARCQHFFLPERDVERSGLGYGSTSLEPRSLIAARMLASWMTVDPDAAKAFAAKLAVPGSPEATDVPISSYELNRLMGIPPTEPKPETNVAEVLAAAAQDLEGPGASSRRSDVQLAVRKSMSADAAGACQWIQQLPLEQRTLIAFDQLRWSMGKAPAATRAETLTMMLQDRQLSAADFRKVAGNCSKPHNEFSGNQQGAYSAAEALREWTTQNPAAARTFVEALPDNDLKALLAGEAAGALARTDPSAAVTLLNQTGGDQTLALQGFMDGWAQTDVHASLEWAGKIEDAQARDACREIVAVRLAGNDPVLALETARTITDPAIRQRIHATVRASLSWNPTALQQMQARFPTDDWNPPRPLTR